MYSVYILRDMKGKCYVGATSMPLEKREETVIGFVQNCGPIQNRVGFDKKRLLQQAWARHKQVKWSEN